jgi:hypothetical protein
MCLKLQGFSFKVVYQPGKLNPADYTSRQPLPLSRCSRRELKELAELEAHINWVVTNDVPPSLKIKEIRSAIHHDPVLRNLYKAIKNRQTIDGARFRQYSNVAQELSIAKGVILRGNRIIIPKPLQNKVIKIAYEGHQGSSRQNNCSGLKSGFPGLTKQFQPSLVPVLHAKLW